MMRNASHLLQSPINVLALREYIRKRIVEILDQSGSSTPKALVLDETLVGPLGTIAEYSWLKEHGVEKLYQLEDILDTELRHVTYMIRPTVQLVKTIANHIRDEPSKRYFLAFIPRMTILCEQALIAEGVMGNVNIYELPMDLVPLDSDLLSMELPNAFSDVELHGDDTPLYYAARSLVKLQEVYGVIPTICGKGKSAKLVADMVKRMIVEQDVQDDELDKEIDSVVLLDRRVDMITPLCTQLTYEGLIDEMLDINHGFLSLPPALIPADGPNAPTRNTKLPLNSGDFVYEEIRDLNFAQVGPLLNKRAKKVSEKYEERHGAKSVKEIKTFITQLPGLQAEHQSLRIHTNIAEHIMGKTNDQKFLSCLEQEQMFISGVETHAASSYIEDCINRTHPLSKVLRLMCLQSLINGGLKSKVLEHYRKEIIQTYGFEHLETIYNLEKVGLLSSTTDGFKYANVQNLLRLVVDEVDELNPEDIAYVYSGYAPLSVRLIETLSSPPPMPRNIEVAMRDLPGPHFEHDNTTRIIPGQYRAPTIRVGGQPGNEGAKKKVILVYFLGGVTYAEVAAIRFLAKKSEGQKEYIIATTNMMKAESFLSPLFNPLPIPPKGSR